MWRLRSGAPTGLGTPGGAGGRGEALEEVQVEMGVVADETVPRSVAESRQCVGVAVEDTAKEDTALIKLTSENGTRGVPREAERSANNTSRTCYDKVRFLPFPGSVRRFSRSPVDFAVSSNVYLSFHTSVLVLIAVIAI